MKLRNTIIAFLVMCALIAALYHIKKDREEDEKALEVSQSVFTTDAGSINSIDLANENGRFLLKRLNPAQSGNVTEKMWKVIEPVESDGDGTFISGVASTIESLLKERELEVASDKLKDFGLENPLFELSVTYLNDKGNEVTKNVSFGDKNPGGSSQYIIYSDNPKKIYLTQTTLDYLKDKKLVAFRNKKIFSFAKDDVENISALYPPLGKKFLLQKKKKDYILMSPLQSSADKSAINKFLNNIVNMRVDAFPTEDYTKDPARWGLNKPYAEITLYLKDKTESKFFIGKESGDTNRLYLRQADAGNVVEVRKGLKKDLTLELKDIVDKRIFPWQRDEISKLIINKGTTSAQLENSAGKWRLFNVKDLADQEVADKIFSKLKGYKAREFVSKETDKSYGFSSPENLVVIVIDNKNMPLARISFGKKKNSSLFVQGGKNNFVYIAPASVHDQIIDEMKDIRNSKLFLIDKDNINYIVVEKGPSKVTFMKITEDNEEKWKAKTAGEQTIYNVEKKDIAQDVAMLTDFLTSKKVDGYIDSYNHKKEQAKYGLDRPTVKISVGAMSSDLSSIVIGGKIKGEDHYYVAKENVSPLYRIKSQDPDMLIKLFEPLNSSTVKGKEE